MFYLSSMHVELLHMADVQNHNPMFNRSLLIRGWKKPYESQMFCNRINTFLPPDPGRDVIHYWL